MGSALVFSFELVGATARAQDLFVDYLVHFVKAKLAEKGSSWCARNGLASSGGASAQIRAGGRAARL
jgi:hypothetical protein